MLNKERSKPFFPLPYCFMGEYKASHQKELGDISQTHLVSQAAHQHLEDNVAGNFDEIEGGTGPFVKSASAASTAKHCVSKASSTLYTTGTLGITMRADHQILTGYIFQVRSEVIPC